MKKTNFDLYLEKQLEDPVFAGRFERAGEAWDVALRLAALREEAGLSQKDLARKLHTSQQQISRLESPSYEGHSLSMLRRVAEILGAKVHVTFGPRCDADPMILSDAKTPYRAHKKSYAPKLKATANREL
jgi:transcriptional regulator with XRE-family HTH domain